MSLSCPRLRITQFFCNNSAEILSKPRLSDGERGKFTAAPQVLKKAQANELQNDQLLNM